MTYFLGQICSKIIHQSSTKRFFSLIKDKRSHKFSNYIILKANKDDYEPILKVMHQTFYSDDPTCLTLGIRPNAIMDETVLKNLAEGVSLIAKCKYNGLLVGAAINETSNPWDPDLKEKLANNIQCQRVKQWLLLQAYTQRHPKLWSQYGVPKVFEMSNIFVKRELKGNEVILRLLEESKSLAQNKGYKIFRVNATKKRLSEICVQANMKLAAEIPYNYYLGRKIGPTFNSAFTNKSIQVFVYVND